MKVFAISDPHLSFDDLKPMNIFGSVWDNHWEDIVRNWKEKVSDDDIVLIAGDISWAMKLEDAKRDLGLIGALKGKKVLIRGNHDYWWSSYKKVKEILPEGVYAIQNNAIKFESVIICGSRAWSVPELGVETDEQDIKLYEREKLRLEMSLKEAKALQEEGDIIIAMTHFPPFNSRYLSSHYTDLFKEYGVHSVVYGHLHGNSSRTQLIHEKQGINYYLTSCDKLNNVLQEIQID
ncbi:MAG: metallophosphoesterase [Clostridia bacterium]|nr:metallophosphoesterase [Clostridia bacterium]